MNESEKPCCGTTPLRGRIDMDAIVREVQQNRAMLEACTGHDFSIAIDRRTKQPLDKPSLLCDWKCVHCGGYVDGTKKNWYERGVAHERAREAARLPVEKPV